MTEMVSYVIVLIDLPWFRAENGIFRKHADGYGAIGHSAS